MIGKTYPLQEMLIRCVKIWPHRMLNLLVNLLIQVKIFMSKNYFTLISLLNYSVHTLMKQQPTTITHCIVLRSFMPIYKKITTKVSFLIISTVLYSIYHIRSMVVLYIGIIKVWGFCPKIIIPKPA